MKTIDRPKVADKSDPRYFSLKTAGVKAFTRGEGDAKQYFIAGTASSSVEDRYGDTLTEACQASMLGQARGLTMWLNHSYQVPEDIAGTCVEATLVRATADDGTSCLDLNITLEVDPTNPRALQSWNAVQRGTKLAFSIGGYFLDFDVVDPDDWFSPLMVNAVDLLEISLVGIPANPRSYTKAFDAATEALKDAVVARAESIAKEHGTKPNREIRSLMRKSFGLSADPEEVDTVKVIRCSHDGCETEICIPEKSFDAAYSYVCAAHVMAKLDATSRILNCGHDGCEQTYRVPDGVAEDAKFWCAEHPAPDAPLEEAVPDIQCGVILDFPDSMPADERAAIIEEIRTLWNEKGIGEIVIVGEQKAVADTSTCSAIVESMRCIKDCIESPEHALCVEPAGKAKAAHAILKSLLPDGYDLPVDADLLEAPEPATLAADVPEQLKVEIEKALSKLDDAKSEMETVVGASEKLSADVESRKGEITSLETQKADLEQQLATLTEKVAELKATPTGRKTAITAASKTGGRSKGNESTVPASAYIVDKP